MIFSIEELIYLIIFSLLYLILLAYDFFGREDNMGDFAYFAALLPANYLWYLATLHEELHYFGVMGSMGVLATLWFITVLRDLYLSRGDVKDPSNVAFYVIIAAGVQLILNSILPAIDTIADTMTIGSIEHFGFVWLPDLMNEAGLFSDNIVLFYKLMTTILVIAIMLPLFAYLKNKNVGVKTILVLTLIFASPFAWVSIIWLADAFFPLFLLFTVLLFAMMLKITASS